MDEVANVFVHIFVVSLIAFSGSVQALFYDVGVQQTHWVNAKDFANFLGFGFATPGPQVFSLATFIGYGAGGLAGAVAGTLAIYITPIALSILAGRYIRRWIEKDYAQYFMRTVGLCATGMLAAIALKIIGTNTLSIGYLFIALASFIAINRKINPLFIILFGLVGGLFLI